VFALRGLYQRYGYTPYKMSQFEEYDLYVRNKDFLISDRIITFSGEGGKLMALKPDVTLSIVKNAPEAPGVVQKVYYSENVYRDYREIMQAGLECVGDLTDYDIAEAVLLAVKSLALLGENYVLDISHMGLIAGVLNRFGFDTDAQKKIMTCLRQKSLHELRALCEGKPQAEEVLLAIASCRGGAEALEEIGRGGAAGPGPAASSAGAAGGQRLRQPGASGLLREQRPGLLQRRGVPGVSARNSCQRPGRRPVRQAPPENGPEGPGHRLCHLCGFTSGAVRARRQL